MHARPDTHTDTSVCDSQRSQDTRDVSRGCGIVASPTQGSLTVYRSIGVGRTPSTIKKSVGSGKTASRYGMSEAGATGRIQNSFGCREGGNSRVARGSRPSSPGESTLITAACDACCSYLDLVFAVLTVGRRRRRCRGATRGRRRQSGAQMHRKPCRPAVEHGEIQHALQQP